MGSKTRARDLKEAGVLIVPGATDASPDLEAARETAAEIGYPVACKAAGGGGGKGFRVARSEDELADAFEGAAREGEKFFPTIACTSSATWTTRATSRSRCLRTRTGT